VCLVEALEGRYVSLAKNLRAGLRKGPKPKQWTCEPELLLSPNIPKPLHGVSPRSILGPIWWQKTRHEAYRSTNFHCQACGVYKFNARWRKWLEGHEVYDIDYLLGSAVYIKTVPLCHFCHNFIHDGRLRSLLEKGEIPPGKYIQIIQHGHRVLGEAGLIKPQPYTGPFADWKDWRLIIGDKRYPPKFKSLKEWKKAFE